MCWTLIPYLSLLTLLWGGVPPCQGQAVNRAPHFLPGGDMARFSLAEDTAVGTAVYTLKGTDPEGSEVHFSISGEHFTVDKRSGVVILLKPLDREAEDLVEVIISITDESFAGSEANTVSLRREVPILDVNDNAPQFLGRPYAVKLSEQAAASTGLDQTPLQLNITIVDRDRGVNGDVSLECIGQDQDTCDTFDVQAIKLSEGLHQGLVTLRRDLDFESRAGYTLTLRAIDQAKVPGKRLSATANVAVVVLDVQDQPPLFLNAPYSASIPEESPENTSVLLVRARDGDSGDPRSLALAIEGDHLGYFKLMGVESSASGETWARLLTTDRPVDREHPLVVEHGSIYTFRITATELINNEIPGAMSSTPVTIVITDVDDLLPVFNRREFNLTVSEDIGIGTPLPGLQMTVSDGDIGDNAAFRLHLRDIRNMRNAFSVYPKEARGKVPVVIKVTDPTALDYDVEDESLREIEFDVVVYNNSTTGVEREVGSSRVRLSLADANDNSPTFESGFFRLRVREDATAGSLIAPLTASDRDSGIYGTLIYSLKGFGAEHFRTDPVHGGIYVSNYSRGLDYETQQSYTLTFEARDGGGRVSAVSLVIELEDVNDNRPRFDQTDYSRIVREGATSFEPQLFVKARDVDGPQQGGGIVRYQLASGEGGEAPGIAAQVFAVDPDTGEITIRSRVSAADAQHGHYHFSVRATDLGNPPLSSEARVLIRVGIPGNQRPIFRGTQHGTNNYHVEITEDAAPGTEVITITASDPDGQNSKLIYRINQGAKDNFIIDNKSGIVTVSTDARLDLETSGPSYDVIVHAIDSGVPVRETATATILVKVKDVNNKPPEFLKSQTYVKHISERAPIDELLLTVKALDPDENALLNYTIVEPIKSADKSGVAIESTSAFDFRNLFKLNSSTGELRVASRLNHQAAAVIILTIEARDLNARDGPETQIDRCEVTIYIQAYSERNPIFTNAGWSPTDPMIHQRIPEEMIVGETILTLTARDPVTGKDINHFEALTDANGMIKVEILSGNIILNKRLDYETMPVKMLTFQVRADSDDDDRKTETTITLDIQDINDNTPIFERNIYTASVLESAVHPHVVATVHATDLDASDTGTGYGDVRYTLSSSGGSQSFFEVNETTGVVRLARNAALDRETQSRLSVLVIAYDTPQGGSEQRRTTATVSVEVEDVNDNAPRLTRERYTAVVAENVPIRSLVLSVAAKDPDSGLAGQVQYELLDEGEAQGLFQIDSISGQVTTRKALTGKGRTDPYHLVVRASDQGTPISLYSDSQLEVYIGDVQPNDGVPTFTHPTNNETASVAENSVIGSPVFQVVAMDPDDPNTGNGIVRYKFLDEGGDHGTFKIDPASGLITTRKALDRETKSLYTLAVVAHDLGEPPQQATRLLKIEVTDVDDHLPAFVRAPSETPLEFTVAEEVDLGTEVGALQAFDADIGENAEIDYLITYGNEANIFNLTRTPDNKAIVRIVKRLDREMTAEHLLTIKAFKRNVRPLSLRKTYNRQDMSERQIKIKVEDIDDNGPQFEKNNITIGVRVNVPIDTPLVTLRATDGDEDSNPITYSLGEAFYTSLAPSVMDTVRYNPEEPPFVVGSSTGEIRTAADMHPYVDGYFELAIIGNNSIHEEHVTQAIVRIFVLRDRDLLKFVFGKPPVEVRRTLDSFSREVAEALLLPVSVNVYDAQFHAKADGSLDYSATGSCFQVVGQAEAYDLVDMEVLLQDEQNDRLQKIYEKYYVQGVQRCAPAITTAGTSWIQLLVLIIAAFVGVGSLLAGITTCCLYGRYKRLVRRSVRENSVARPPGSYLASTLVSHHGVPPGTIVMGPPSAMAPSEGPPRMYEWGVPEGSVMPASVLLDNRSYQTLPRGPR